jgi:hypothetical protein
MLLDYTGCAGVVPAIVTVKLDPSETFTAVPFVADVTRLKITQLHIKCFA